MQTFDTITAARGAIFDYRAGTLSAAPAEVVAKVRDLSASPSPVDQIVRIGEFLYARRADLDDAGRALAGGLISFATINAWHGLLDDSRGDKITQAIRRDLGETPPAGMAWPTPGDDPAPVAEYAPTDQARSANILTVPQYYALFTADELAAINASDDAQIKNGISALQIVASVNLADQPVISGIDRMVTLGLITAESAARKKAGLPPATA